MFKEILQIILGTENLFFLERSKEMKCNLWNNVIFSNMSI